MGLGPGFNKDVGLLEKARARGDITKSEFRQALRQAGLELLPDDVVFPPPRPLLPVHDEVYDAWEPYESQLQAWEAEKERAATDPDPDSGDVKQEDETDE